MVNEVNDTLAPIAIENFGIPAGAFDQAAFDTLLDEDEADDLLVQFFGSPNLLHTLDRRVTLEVGCSLPLKNSPMIDHGKESPDVVLGRYMFHRPYDINRQATDTGTTVSITDKSIGALQLQGPNDRIVYHALSPQQKIQQLRLKLWLN